MSSLDGQALTEQKIFRRFAEVCPLAICLDSIEKRQPPQPDILCEIKGKGKVAFEMVELVDSGFSRRLHGGVDLRRQFKKTCEQRPAMKNSFGDAFIYVEFHSHLSKQKRNECVARIVNLLLKMPPNFEGDVPLNKEPRLAKVVKDLAVQRGNFKEPFFGTIPAGRRVDRSLSLIKQKFKKSYKTTAPIELLAYFYQEPPPRGSDWLSSSR